MATIKDIMTNDVQTINSDEPMSKAAQMMSQCGIRHLVVVNTEGKPDGVFSDRDVLRYLVRSLNDPANRPKDTVAIDLATKQLMTVKPETPITEAAALMADKKIGCLPVVDDQSALAGIVTAVDILKHTGHNGSTSAAEDQEQKPAT